MSTKNNNKLSAYQLEEIDTWFNEHHTMLQDGDDSAGMEYITIELLEQFYKDITFPLVEYSYYNIIKETETMGIVDRVINKDQFFQLVNMWIIVPKPIDELKVALKVFDTENRGYMNIVELQQILGVLGDKFTAEESQEFAYDANMTGLGNVDYNAFVDSMFLVAPKLAEIEVEFIYPPEKTMPEEEVPEKEATPQKKDKKKKKKKNKK